MGSGAGDETRTRDINLGKVALYQLSYTRRVKRSFTTGRAGRQTFFENFFRLLKGSGRRNDPGDTILQDPSTLAAREFDMKPATAGGEDFERGTLVEGRNFFRDILGWHFV